MSSKISQAQSSNISGKKFNTETATSDTQCPERSANLTYSVVTVTNFSTHLYHSISVKCYSVHGYKQSKSFQEMHDINHSGSKNVMD